MTVHREGMLLLNSKKKTKLRRRKRIFKISRWMVTLSTFVSDRSLTAEWGNNSGRQTETV